MVRYMDLPGVLVVSLLVVVDSVVVGGTMASLHHLVTYLHGVQDRQQRQAGHHQMYTDMQRILLEVFSAQ